MQQTPIFNPTSPHSGAPTTGLEPAAGASPALGDAGAPPPADPHYLPDGAPLLLTLSRKMYMGRLFGDDADTYAGPANPTQDLTLLFLCAHPREVWMAPGRETAGGAVLPLIQRQNDFQRAIDHFADTALGHLSIAEMSALAISLWRAEHATHAIPKKKIAPPESPSPTTKQTPSSPTGPSNTSTSSPPETPGVGTTSSTSSPSEPSTAACTAISTITASPASPP